MGNFVQMSPGQRSALSNVVLDLHIKFQGVFGQETIEALVLDSFRELAAKATVSK